MLIGPQKILFRDNGLNRFFNPAFVPIAIALRIIDISSATFVAFYKGLQFKCGCLYCTFYVFAL